MKLIPRHIAAVTATAVVAGVAYCSHVVSRYERAFDDTRGGESLAEVISRFGPPSVREVPAHPFLTYATSGCVSPCVVRMWWEHPVLNGIEAWSVEFNDRDQVVDSAHWVSP